MIQFGMDGQGNSIPAPGDYDGSGKTEVAAYLPSLGEFVYRPANGGADVFVHISAVERAGLSGLNDGQKVSYEEERDPRKGKTSAVNLKAL